MEILINSVNGINQKGSLPLFALWDAKNVVFALISACKITISCLFCKKTLLFFCKFKNLDLISVFLYFHIIYDIDTSLFWIFGHGDRSAYNQKICSFCDCYFGCDNSFLIIFLSFCVGSVGGIG